MEKVIWSYASVSIVAILLAGIAYLVSTVAVKKYNERITNVAEAFIRVLAAIFLLVAGIGRLGTEIESWGGTSPPEVLNDWIFYILSSLGSFFVFLDIFVLYKRQELKNANR